MHLKGHNSVALLRRIPQVYLASLKILKHSLMIKRIETEMKFKIFTKIGKPKKHGLVIEEVRVCTND